MYTCLQMSQLNIFDLLVQRIPFYLIQILLLKALKTHLAPLVAGCIHIRKIVCDHGLAQVAGIQGLVQHIDVAVSITLNHIFYSFPCANTHSTPIYYF